MKLTKFARKLLLKYAAELFDPNADADQLKAILINNIKGIFKEEFERASLLHPMPSEQDGQEVETIKNGNFYQLKLMVNRLKDLAPNNVKDKINTNLFLNKIEKKFKSIVDGIDDKNIIEINSELIEVLEFLEETKAQINDSINLNKYISFLDRKHLFGTVQKVIDNFKFKVRKQIEFIDRGKGPTKWEKEEGKLMSEVALPTITPLGNGRYVLPSGTEMSKRKRMLLTNPKTEKLVMLYGPLYGINSQEAWGKLVDKDFETAEQLMTAFLGMLGHSFKYKESPNFIDKHPKNKALEEAELNSLVKDSLKLKIKSILNPAIETPMPYGILPKRPPGK